MAFRLNIRINIYLLLRVSQTDGNHLTDHQLQNVTNVVLFQTHSNNSLTIASEYPIQTHSLYI